MLGIEWTPNTVLFFVTLAGFVVLGLAALSVSPGGRGCAGIFGIVVLGALILLVPNGTLLIAVGGIVAVVYIMSRIIGPSISVHCGDGDGDRNVTINYQK